MIGLKYDRSYTASYPISRRQAFKLTLFSLGIFRAAQGWGGGGRGLGGW